MNKSLESVAIPLGRLLLSSIFILSGAQKIMQYSSTAEHMSNEGMPIVDFFLVGAIVVEILGGLSILLGVWPRIGALVLFLYLIPTTLIFHDFWTFEGQQRQMQMINFMKNLAIMGGLSILLGFGSGPLSVTGSHDTK